MSDAKDKITPFEVVKSKLMSQEFTRAVQMALPKHLDEGKMIRVVLTSMMKNQRLQQCTPQSVLSSVLEASQLGLMPDGATGQAYLVPYRDNKTNTVIAQFQIGYRGMLKLIRQSGAVKSIHAQVIYENDDFDYGLGAHPYVTHKPPKLGSPRGKAIGAYAVAILDSDEIVFEVMSEEDVQAIRKRSRAGTEGPWVTDTDAMRRKTAIRRLYKYLPISVDIAEQIERDEAVDLGYRDVTATFQVEEPKPGLDTLTEKLKDEDAGLFPSEPVDAEIVEEPPPASPAPKGRISLDENEAFMKELTALLTEITKYKGEAWCDTFYKRTLGSHGVEKPQELRSRKERDALLKDIRDMKEQIVSDLSE